VTAGLYQRRPITVEACQWDRSNTADMTAFLGADFTILDEQDRANSDDPAATAQLLEMPAAQWTLLYDGDWAVKDGNAQYRMPADVFAEEWEPIQP
jgi:hypothetical protein